MKYYHEMQTIQHSDGSGYTYDYGYNIEKLPIDKPIWGFAYDINDDTENRRLSCLPVLGEISKNLHGKPSWSTYCFYPYKKGTHTKRQSGKVDFNSRCYADTYGEAVEMYNELVQQRIDNLKRMVKQAEKDKIV